MSRQRLRCLPVRGCASRHVCVERSGTCSRAPFGEEHGLTLRGAFRVRGQGLSRQRLLGKSSGTCLMKAYGILRKHVRGRLLGKSFGTSSRAPSGEQVGDRPEGTLWEIVQGQDRGHLWGKSWMMCSRTPSGEELGDMLGAPVWGRVRGHARGHLLGKSSETCLKAPFGEEFGVMLEGAFWGRVSDRAVPLNAPSSPNDDCAPLLQRGGKESSGFAAVPDGLGVSAQADSPAVAKLDAVCQVSVVQQLQFPSPAGQSYAWTLTAGSAKVRPRVDLPAIEDISSRSAIPCSPQAPQSPAGPVRVFHRILPADNACDKCLQPTPQSPPSVGLQARPGEATLARQTGGWRSLRVPPRIRGYPPLAFLSLPAHCPQQVLGNPRPGVPEQMSSAFFSPKALVNISRCQLRFPSPKVRVTALRCQVRFPSPKVCVIIS